MNKKIIRNARIITMNERLDILPNGNILIENGKISAITTQSLEDTDAEITDAEGMFLLPGLINTHTHLPMTMLRALQMIFRCMNGLPDTSFRQKPGW